MKMKRFSLRLFIGIIGLSGLVFLLLSASVASAQLTKGLALYLEFDETSGDVVKDSSGNKNDGKIIGTTVKRVSGKFGGGVEIDATQGNYVQVPNSPSLNPTDEITITVWLNLAEAGGNRRILQKGTPGSDDQYRLLLEGGGTFFRIHIRGLTPVDRIQTTGLFSLNEWHHAAGVYDGKKMRIYLDGKETASADATGKIPVVDGPMFIGTKWQNAPSGDYWKGKMDEVMVFSRALSADEIAKLIQESVVAVEPKAKLATTWAQLKENIK